MKLLVCGDVHLTNYTSFNHSVDNPISGSRLEYILKALDYFFDYGNKHDIHTFVINGDLFDQRQRDNPSTLEYIRYRIISKFRQINGDNNLLYINTGNHDQATRQVTPSAIEHFDLYRTNSHFVQVVNKVTLITDCDHEYLFIPYSEDVQKLKNDIKKTLKEDKEKYPIYVFAHLGVDGAVQGRWNHRLSDAFNLDDLGWNDPRVRLITLGHFHTRSTLYPNVCGSIKLPSDNPTKYSIISPKTLDTIEYNFNILGMNIDYNKGLLLNRSIYKDKNGYIRTSLRGEDSKLHTVGVATIIAYKKFGRKSVLNKQVDHINNKHGVNDNYPDNLQLVTPRENLEKEMSDNSKRIPCKAKNYFTGIEIHANSIYELSKRIGVAVSSIQKCVHKKANVAGDYLVALEHDSFRNDISFNHFCVQGKRLSDGRLTPVFNDVSEAEQWMNIPAGNSHIGEVCREIYKQTKGYTWWYVPSHPEAFYQGDLTELNFNDIQKNGYGASRGFDVVDTEGGHTFVDLTKAPYNLPTFNSFDLDKDKISTDNIIDLLKHENYVRLMVSDKDKYEKLSEIVAKEYPNNVQLILKPQPNEHDDIKIDPNTTDNDLVAQYCEKHYPEIKDQALEYLRKAKES